MSTAPLLEVQRRITQSKDGPIPNLIVDNRNYIGEVGFSAEQRALVYWHGEATEKKTKRSSSNK